jgi:tetratricopeptide (TPR) repeat protein
MIKKYFIAGTIILLSQAAMAKANEETSSGNHSADMTSANNPHSVAVHGSAAADKDQPFWSEQQSKQADLEAQYKQAIANNPENPNNYAYLAGLYLSNNKTEAAIDAYQEAITHNPGNAKLFAAISIAYLHQSKFSMAKAMANEALRLDPSLKQVEKINEYIDAKQETIDAASKVSQQDVNNAKSDSSMDLMQAMPVDAVHGNSNTLRNKNLDDWTHSPK